MNESPSPSPVSLSPCLPLFRDGFTHLQEGQGCRGPQSPTPPHAHSPLTKPGDSTLLCASRKFFLLSILTRFLSCACFFIIILEKGQGPPHLSFTICSGIKAAYLSPYSLSRACSYHS